jgi:hypothetical protein
MANAKHNMTIGSAAAVTVFDSANNAGDIAATTVKVSVRSGSAAGCLVRVHGVNTGRNMETDPSHWDRLAAGEKEYYRSGNGGVTKVVLKGDGGDATVDFSVVART